MRKFYLAIVVFAAIMTASILADPSGTPNMSVEEAVATAPYVPETRPGAVTTSDGHPSHTPSHTHTYTYGTTAVGRTVTDTRSAY